VKRLPYLLAAAGLALAGVSGYLASAAIGLADQPVRTVTVNVGTGVQGPPGPAGPAGPRGPAGPAGLACLAGYSPGVLRINAVGGHVQVYTCLED
jgi:hypothetical protein